jgi:2-deoxy-D-gluconate 3-dehydrogenase
MLEQRRGRIVLVASNLGLSGGRDVAAYAASKGGVVQLARALANDWGPMGVNVNALAPAYIKTDLNKGSWHDPAKHAAVVARLPARRWGEPADIRGAALFLASAASDYVHGAVLPVDGGWLAT